MARKRTKQRGHTPGPWKTVRPGHGHPTDCLSVQIGADEMYTTLEMLPADARLTSAAPDLVAALKAIVAAWESVPEDQQVPEALNVDRLWADARKAIRRAEGK